jgi:hypothetical protein
VVELVTGKEILPGTPNDIYEIIDAIRNFDASDFLAAFLAEGGQIWDILTDFFNPIRPGFEGDEEFFATPVPVQRPTGYHTKRESSPEGLVITYWYYEREITREEYELGIGGGTNG